MKKGFNVCILIVLLIFIGHRFQISDDLDNCLSGGVCKAGLIIKDSETGKEFEVKQSTCLQFNGQWREKYNDCYFN